MTGPQTDTVVHTLPNGVRVLTCPMPHLATASVSVFVRSGSVHESRRLNGISHVIEHMVFKGTAGRSRRRINLDAESLGAEVNAHTDKDHTAFHMQGLAAHAPQFVQMLGDLVAQPRFPADEFEHEREVLLAEFTEDEDDAMSCAFKLFDKACFGAHALARSVIGTRANIEAFSRDALAVHHAQHYTGGNIIVAAAGAVVHAEIERAAQAALGGLAMGSAPSVSAARYRGGLASRQIAGTGQAHLVIGFATPGLADDDASSALAAAVLGEGMSSPLMERLREELGYVYYTACSADVFEAGGQFVIEASMAPNRLDATAAEIARLLALQCRRVREVDVQRARHQLLVRRLRALERPAQRLEDAALELFALGRVRSPAEHTARIEALGAADVRRAFARMRAAGPSLAVTGHTGRGVRARLRAAWEGAGGGALYASFNR